MSPLQDRVHLFATWRKPSRSRYVGWKLRRHDIAQVGVQWIMFQGKGSSTCPSVQLVAVSTCIGGGK
eukprot:scaffold3108_cov711-Pavlova_lutheri.AAC.1